MKMSLFDEKLRELQKEFPFETQICFEALRAHKIKLIGEVKDLRIELTGIPEKGLFGELLRKEHLDKIEDLQNKIKLL